MCNIDARSERDDKINVARLITVRLATDAGSLSKQWSNPEGTPTRHFSSTAIVALNATFLRDMVLQLWSAYLRLGMRSQ
jgi:hypothetical protein